MKCKMCGSENEKMADFCKFCGNELVEITIEPELLPETDSEMDDFYDSDEQPDIPPASDIPIRTNEEQGTDPDVPETIIRPVIDDDEDEYPDDEPVYIDYDEEETKYSLKKRRIGRTIATVFTLAVAMAVVFAVTFVCFFRLLGGTFTDEEEAFEDEDTTYVSTPEPHGDTNGSLLPTAFPAATDVPDVELYDEDDFNDTDDDYNYSEPHEQTPYQVIPEEGYDSHSYNNYNNYDNGSDFMEY